MMNTALDFVFAHMPVETAELEWIEFLVTPSRIPSTQSKAPIDGRLKE